MQIKQATPTLLQFNPQVKYFDFPAKNRDIYPLMPSSKPLCQTKQRASAQKMSRWHSRGVSRRQFVSQETKATFIALLQRASKLGVIHTLTHNALAHKVNTTLARSRVGCRASPGLIFTLGLSKYIAALGARAASRLPLPTYQYSNNMYAHTHKRRIYTQQQRRQQFRTRQQLCWK
jgi:hypothetical protein